MFRKIIFAVLLMFIMSSCELVQAAPKSKKYTGPLVRDCSIYQLGGDEFILKINGSRLPEPEIDIDNNSMNIILSETSADNPEKINSSVLEFIEIYPLIYGFFVLPVLEENDNIFTTYVHIDTTIPLKCYSSTRSNEGLTMRFKAERGQNNFSLIDNISLSNMMPPPSFSSNKNANKPSSKSSNIVFPESTLPFRSNATITIVFRDAELQDVLRAFMEYLGRNMVLDASFPRDVKVTMSLVDVRVDEVINYLLRTYDLACYSYGPNITAFGTKAGLYKLSGAGEIKIFNISFADPTKIREYLKSITGVEDSALTLDERMRTLYVNTNPAKMEEVEEIISKLDVPQKQVLIRASIFEFNDTVTREVENALEIAYDEWTINLRRGLDMNYYESRRGGTPSTLRTLTGVFTALEAKNKGKVLANPSVIAIDGQEATIELTQTYVYSNKKDEAGNLITDEEEVGPTLKFTPKVERDGFVYLDIDLETGDVVGSFNDTPITSKRHVQTKIRVKDGQPFVIGGLFQDNKSRTVSRIPVLGDIPLLGNLFSYRTGTNSRTQAVMVVTPYILDN
ncbi:MAG: hypothetical protein IJU48_10990 [Synergistaceae bacterium]|nr:hypothetical protein [Synergistaceae bacterium]